MKTRHLLFISTLFISTFISAQAPKKFKDSGTVANQFDFLIKNSNRYQEYKVVNTIWLTKLKSNVTDSLKVSKKELNSTYDVINGQKKSIDSLKMALNESSGKIEGLSKEIESVSLFGILIEKGTFKTILFSIIGVLAAFLLLFISKFKRSIAVTNQTKLSYKELDEEFESHRKKALEREQKVRRQLQDELNKQKKDK